MDTDKDYYATLGLTPSADAVVIRAAYRALAQRYHPDKAGSSDNARMAEINEAYEILSDPQKRAEYDRQREKKTQSADTAFADGNEEPTTRSPLDDDWQTAVQFYPELVGLRSRLAKLSWKVADAFRARILQNKEFTTAEVVAERLEGEFLSLYFGTNPMILAFARSLIRDGRRDAARDLNQAIRVIGASSDPEKVIAVIREKYRIQSTEMDVPIPNGGVSAWELIFAVLLILAVGVGLIETIPSH
jgi:curved DNA-binding protein CbpA